MSLRVLSTFGKLCDVAVRESLRAAAPTLLEEAHTMSQCKYTSVLLCGAVLAVFAGAAGAVSPQRTFVSTGGNDANPCSLASPCRSFGTATAAVASGGEVIVLDSGGYGPFTITKPVSIISPEGVYAGISVATGDGINVNAPNGVVRLRGLSIIAQGTSGNGITDLASPELHIERCHISGFKGTLLFSAGIEVATHTDTLVYVADSTLSDNSMGVEILNDAGMPSVSVERSSLKGNSVGVEVLSPSRVLVHASQLLGLKDVGIGVLVITGPVVGAVELHVDDSVIDGADTGMELALGSSTFVSASVVRTYISHAFLGMRIRGGASAAIADSRFVHNDTAIEVDAGSTLFTGGNTYMAYNGAYVTGGGTISPPAGNL
jgi:hypothetical protein